MAGTLIVSNLKTDTDNTFIVRSNTGTTLFSANTSGIDIANSIGATAITNDKILSVANTKITGNIISSQIAPSVTLTTPLISGNLNLDSTGTSGIRLTSANTITFHTTGTEDVRIDANGNVSIGTASAQTKFHVSNTATNTVKTRTESSTGYVEVGMGGNSGVFDTTATDGIRLRMSGVDKVAIDGSTFSISGLQGIKFPATQSASTDANTLDDYEEGTWTPALNFGGGSTGITYSGQLGTYVKIGKLVWLNCRLTLTAKGSSTGSARVTGLPFTNQGGSSNGEIQLGSVWYNSFNNASNYHINLRQDASAAPNYMEFRAYSGGSETEVNQTWFNNTSQFSFTIFSMVTA